MFNLTSFGTLKYDYIIKTIEIINFLPLINNPVTTGFSFLLLIISAIISSKATNILWAFFQNYIFQYFYKHLPFHLNIQQNL